MQYLIWAKELIQYCSDPCRVNLLFEDELRELSIDHKEAVQKLAAIRKQVEQLAVTILNPKIEIKNGNASVTANVRGMGKSPGRDDYFLESHQIKFELTKTQREWKIELIENLDPIKRYPH